MKRFFYILTLISILVTSCDSNDKHEQDSDSTIDESALEEIYYERLLMNLSDIDTLSIGTSCRIPKLGVCLYPANSDEFYLLADNSENAYSHFLDLMIPGNCKDRITISGNERVFTMQDATLKFRSINIGEKVAEVDVDIPEIPGLKKIFFLTELSWPENSNDSPFEVGEVWTDNNRSSWLCVKDSRQGNGRLLQVHEGTLCYFMDYESDFQDPFEVCTQGASKETWLAYKEFRRKYPQRIIDTYNAIDDMITQRYEKDHLRAPGFLGSLWYLLRAEEPDDVFIIGKPKVQDIEVYTPARPYYYRYYYIVEFDYYDISRNEICHYKTSSRYEEPLVTMWSDELIFKSGDYNNNPREFGWELIVNE